jgi:hypothetical protein
MVRVELKSWCVWVVGISEHGEDDQVQVDNFSSGCGQVFKTKAYVGLVELIPAEGNGDLTCKEGSKS